MAAFYQGNGGYGEELGSVTSYAHEQIDAIAGLCAQNRGYSSWDRWEIVLSDLRQMAQLAPGETLYLNILDRQIPVNIDDALMERIQLMVNILGGVDPFFFFDLPKKVVDLFADVFTSANPENITLLADYFTAVFENQPTGKTVFSEHFIESFPNLRSALEETVEEKRLQEIRNQLAEELGKVLSSSIKLRVENSCLKIAFPNGREVEMQLAQAQRFAKFWDQKKAGLDTYWKRLDGMMPKSLWLQEATLAAKYMALLHLLRQCDIPVSETLWAHYAKDFGENCAQEMILWEKDSAASPNASYFETERHRRVYQNSVLLALGDLPEVAKSWVIAMNGGRIFDRLEDVYARKVHRICDFSLRAENLVPALQFLLTSNDNGVAFADLLSRITLDAFPTVFQSLRAARYSPEELYQFLQLRNSANETALGRWLGYGGEKTQKVIAKLMKAIDYPLEDRAKFVQPFIDEMFTSVDFPQDRNLVPRRICEILGVQNTVELRKCLYEALQERFYQKNLGNCFVVSLLIRFQRDEPEVLARLMVDLLTQGKVSLGVGRQRSVDMPANLDFEGHANMHGILEATLANQVEIGRISYARCVLYNVVSKSDVLTTGELDRLQSLMLFGGMRFEWKQERGRFEANLTFRDLVNRLSLPSDRATKLLSFMKGSSTETFYFNKKGQDDYIFCLEGNDADNAYRNLFPIDSTLPTFNEKQPSAQRLIRALSRLGKSADLPEGRLVPLVLSDHEANAYIMGANALDNLHDGEILPIGETNWERMRHFAIQRHGDEYNLVGCDQKGNITNSDGLFDVVTLYDPVKCTLDICQPTTA